MKLDFVKDYSTDWQALDNAAKIFPSNSSKKDTKVFRFAAELYEDIDADILQKALDETIKEFPLFRSTLHRGVFWYYLKDSNIKPKVKRENAPPCSSIYDADIYNLLFEVTYFNKRINLEVYHAITDGTGALHFLRVLVYYYITIKYSHDFDGSVPKPDYDASINQKAEDSFKKYYKRDRKNKSISESRAYKIRGTKTAEHRIKVIEGTVSLKRMLDKARSLDTTLTVLLVSLFLCAINKNAELSRKKRPIVLMVPVNLRKYFRSESARNFFCTINAGYNFDKDPDDFESVVKYVNEYFKKQLNAENLAARMNRYTKIERNAFVRITPLWFKDIILNIAGEITRNETTGAISNVGSISMPDGFEKYIRLFDMCISTDKLQICVCSYMDNLVISFSSSFKGTDIQKDFFRSIVGMGIDVSVVSNKTSREEL
ncbi:MAG: hypothetical protein J1F64_04475 [Oscillospiraceae bacterium]|nr:hypothetical protein [Oscillospiraceae bacterium]